MDNNILKEFHDFCKEQGDVRIDNSRWNVCAVGKFLSSKGIKLSGACLNFPHLVESEHPNHKEYAKEFENQLKEASVYVGLNSGRYTTYQQLTNVLGRTS